jgi:hypothetical protein
MKLYAVPLMWIYPKSGASKLPRWYRLWYLLGVSNAAKLIAKMRRNPRDWRIEDLKVVALSLGIDHDQHGTSHMIFRHASAGRLSVPAHRPIKPVYVRLFVEFVDTVGKES